MGLRLGGKENLRCIFCAHFALVAGRSLFLGALRILGGESLLELPLPNVGEPTSNRGRGGHHRADQVRPSPRPCRPSKFRLLVAAHRSPGCRISGFIPRHIEQPDSRHSNPASRKIRSSPSCSAAFFTACDPGTTMARTFGFTRYPLATLAAARRSSS